MTGPAATALLPTLLGVPLLGALVLLVLPERAGDRVARWVGVVASGLALGVAVTVAASGPWGAGVRLGVDRVWVRSLGLHVRLGVDGLSLPFVLLTAVLAFLCLCYTLRSLPEPGRAKAFVGTLLLLETGMLATFVVLDLVLFFLAFEVVLVPMWFVIARWGGEGRRAAATTFILYTLTGSAVMLVGLLVLATSAHTTDMVALTSAHGAGLSRGTQLLAFLTIGAGLAVKSPMWPLHTWLPPAHTAAPTVGSVLLAGVLLKMGTYGFLRIAVPMLPDGLRVVGPYLGAFAVAGILAGALACLVERDLKRLVAYSSVGHMGFVLLGVASGTAAGLNGAVFASIAHGLITGLLFFLVGALKDRHHSSDLADIGGGLYSRAPRLGGLLAFGAVASLGLPGLAGFWGEVLALLGAYRVPAGPAHRLFAGYLCLGALGTVLAAAYLLRVVRRVAQGESLPQWAGMADARGFEVAVWSPLVVGTLVLGVAPGVLLSLTSPTVARLVGGG